MIKTFLSSLGWCHFRDENIIGKSATHKPRENFYDKEEDGYQIFSQSLKNTKLHCLRMFISMLAKR